MARALENVGYYVIDNLPEALVGQAAALAAEGGPEVQRSAMVLDVRSLAFMTDLVGVIDELRSNGFRPTLVFVDADDDVIIRRYEKVRRAHPLQGDGALLDGITAERRLLEPAKESADMLFDTSLLNENQLRSRVEEAFLAPSTPGLQFTVMSFGFKYGIPRDADYLADVRFLPNPYWVPELREFTGQNPEVSKYVLSRPGAEDFVDSYSNLLLKTVPGFEREGKRYITVAIGCTGGKHRSVAITEELASRLNESGYPTTVQNRDAGRE